MGGKHGGAQIHDTSEHSSQRHLPNGAKVMASSLLRSSKLAG